MTSHDLGRRPGSIQNEQFRRFHFKILDFSEREILDLEGDFLKSGFQKVSYKIIQGYTIGDSAKSYELSNVLGKMSCPYLSPLDEGFDTFDSEFGFYAKTTTRGQVLMPGKLKLGLKNNKVNP